MPAGPAAPCHRACTAIQPWRRYGRTKPLAALATHQLLPRDTTETTRAAALDYHNGDKHPLPPTNPPFCENNANLTPPHLSTETRNPRSRSQSHPAAVARSLLLPRPDRPKQKPPTTHLRPWMRLVVRGSGSVVDLARDFRIPSIR